MKKILTLFTFVRVSCALFISRLIFICTLVDLVFASILVDERFCSFELVEILEMLDDNRFNCGGPDL